MIKVNQGDLISDGKNKGYYLKGLNDQDFIEVLEGSSWPRSANDQYIPEDYMSKCSDKYYCINLEHYTLVSPVVTFTPFKYNIGDKVKAKKGGHYFSDPTYWNINNSFPSEQITGFNLKEGYIESNMLSKGIKWYKIKNCYNGLWISEEGLELVVEEEKVESPQQARFSIGDIIRYTDGYTGVYIGMYNGKEFVELLENKGLGFHRDNRIPSSYVPQYSNVYATVQPGEEWTKVDKSRLYKEIFNKCFRAIKPAYSVPVGNGLEHIEQQAYGRISRESYPDCSGIINSDVDFLNQQPRRSALIDPLCIIKKEEEKLQSAEIIASHKKKHLLI